MMASLCSQMFVKMINADKNNINAFILMGYDRQDKEKNVPW